MKHREKCLEILDAELIEMKRCRSKGLCCGAGGAQMWKEEEKGTTRVNFERTEEAINTGANIIAAACPYCNTMLTDGVKNKEKEDTVKSDGCGRVNCCRNGIILIIVCLKSYHEKNHTRFYSCANNLLLYHSQQPVQSYIKKTYMIPMRDGTKLFTVLLIPYNDTTAYPFLIERTPYGADFPIKEDSPVVSNNMGYYKTLAEGGYIFVFQDMRGKFKSEGTFEMNRPLYHLTDKTKTDESTDAWDTVDWLIKNIKHNNGKAGIIGISYPGYLALDASVDPHPALKASSPQASPTDMFLGDDFHHNGAFRLSYGFEYSYLVENDKESNSDFPFPALMCLTGI